MRTQSVQDECYSDRNILIQCLAAKLLKEGIDVFIDYDKETVGYIVLCIQIKRDTQLSFHIPIEELILNVPIKKNKWIPMDVNERKIKMIDIINGKI